MSLEHAILGFLSYHPFSGYDLKKCFDESVRHFWPATQSQIYRTLKRMADDGWVDMEVFDQEDRPDRKVYHLTADGASELLHWLSAPTEPASGRSEWLIRVFFANQLANEQIVSMFAARATLIRQRLKVLQTDTPRIIDQRFGEVKSERARTLWDLTRENGVTHMECELEWIESAIERLRGMPVE